jgi:hypothetical protein
MNAHSAPSLETASLAGARIWLSGSLPEVEASTEMERATILEFVHRFSSMVFRQGGHILHGSHPSFTPALLQEAEAHQRAGGKKDCLTLAVSRLWSKDSTKAPVDEWQKTSLVYETPEVKENRDESLNILRKWMAARCDAVVAVGGKWWQEIAGQAGVPLEVSLAIERGIPCFLLGGLGGAAQGYLAKYPQLLSQLKNGLDEPANRSLSTESDVASLAGKVCEQLGRLPLVRGRGADGVSFRILALDGGGIKGTFTASALATWEEHTKLRIVDHFDLVAGTSTGGILAIGLGMGLSGKQMLTFYQTRGPVIFPVTSFAGKLRHTLRHLFRPKFSQEVLLKELERAYYGGREPITLRDSRCRLLIPTYHAVAGASHLFRTPHHPDLTADANTEAALAALATAAAPTFFQPRRLPTWLPKAVTLMVVFGQTVQRWQQSSKQLATYGFHWIGSMC